MQGTWVEALVREDPTCPGAPFFSSLFWELALQQGDSLGPPPGFLLVLLVKSFDSRQVGYYFWFCAVISLFYAQTFNKSLFHKTALG